MTRYQITVLCVLGASALALGFSLIGANAVGVDMSRAAQGYLDTLSDAQKAQAQLAFETPDRLGWHFIPKSERKGMQIKDMSPAQRQATQSLLRSALSQVGYDKTVKIMALEHILDELEKNRSGGSIRDPERYYVTIFGEPTESGKWGLSVEGHHLSLNFVVDQGKVVSSTPTFMGANPAIVRSEVSSGLAVGTRVLAKEEEMAFQLVESLDEGQLQTALLAEKAPREIRAAGEAQPPQEAPQGLSWSSMNGAQRQQLRSLVEAYLENMPDEVSAARRSAIIEAGPAGVYFAWAGPTKPGIGHYYRVQGPTFLIELANTQPDASGNPANHVHCVWRDMRGDFAVALAGGS